MPDAPTAPPTSSTDARASIGVIGGSGLYSLFAEARSVSIPTPYGETSSPITLGELGGRTVAFLTRHGVDHSSPPHLINYRANIWALKSLGVKAIISSAAVGGVSSDYPPSTLVLTDQFIDRTWGRADTFFDGASVQHLAAADPFCPELHARAGEALTAAGEAFAPAGTVVVVQGPRFSTRAESLWYRAAGAHTVNMTLVPEVTLAAELNMGTVNLSFVTDADAGLAPLPPGAATSSAVASSDEEAVSAELVFRRLKEAQPRIVAAIETIIRAIPDDYEPRELIPASAVAAVLAQPAAQPTHASTLPSATAGA
ncbi:MTAP family purine nucleoside phosphorylase [Subtercola sp. YIM 133946]|uniref:MTAP family purine nucleoside phosphorylase n=1 Tax=Subtercola sp. YIM 133946 TaxID=3118909 RepID=UPI002F9292F0